MGLWLKQGDDLVPVGGGGGGSFDGEHVLTGDPLDPPEELQVGQLLYDGDPSTGGGGSFDGEHVPTGDPTDPAMFDAVDVGQLMWDGVEGGGSGGPHDHDDYLPLTGGTVTGDLQVDGTVATINPGSEGAPAYTSTLYPTTGMYGHAEGVFFAVDGNWTFGSWADRVGIRNNLQVDGLVSFGATSAGDWQLKLHDASPTHFHGIGVGMNSLTFHVGDVVAAELSPGGWAFNVAAGIDTADVLERAETATMPALDDEGVATMDADVESITVNEVVTALLAKVKELSAEIEELKGN